MSQSDCICLQAPEVSGHDCFICSKALTGHEKYRRQILTSIMPRHNDCLKALEQKCSPKRKSLM